MTNSIALFVTAKGGRFNFDSLF